MDRVLIVPYGIETDKKTTSKNHLSVLIVPYGIETLSLFSEMIAFSVLIVPYGIETQYEAGRNSP